MAHQTLHCEEGRIRGFDGTDVGWVNLGAGHPLVISSPVGLPFEFWTPLLAALQTRCRIIFIRRRGLWGTEVPLDLENLGVEAHARDIADVVRAQDLQDFTLLGYCSGIAAALESLKFTPALPARLVLLSGRFGPSPSVLSRAMYERVCSRPGLKARAIDIMMGFAPREWRPALAHELAQGRALEAYLVALEAARAYRPSSEQTCNLPTFLFLAQHDNDDIRQSTLSFRDSLSPSRVTLLEVPEAGHFYPSEKPQFLIDALSRILPSQPLAQIEQPASTGF